ncbi:hypothetical protein LKV13_00140 [Borrelia sp. BU AG58]|uniref:hypothetical protein n=1 Tax=Borrelia sp. BU AG58 TaxID=2887345 RepID=UPI001E4EEAEC|nr:hypothetical protein [Borrelia sp. BU AG58]UER67252.1 hypothetical protein LKV13_00140 [Borrelia sp. BU AG58]
MNSKDLKKLILIVLTLMVGSCSSESIFSQLSKLQKISSDNNTLDSSSPNGVSLVDNTLYIAAMHLFKKENGNVERVNFSDSYEFVIDLVNILGKTYLLAQSKEGKLELYILENDKWKLMFQKNLNAIKFLKSIDATEVKSAYILASEENGNQIILDINGGNRTPAGTHKGDKFYQISNEHQLITGRFSKIWKLDNGEPVHANSKNEIMPIIDTNIRGFSETLIMTGGGYSDSSDNKLAMYSSIDNYQEPVFNREDIGGFVAYFAREVNGTIVIGSNNGFVELVKGEGTFDLQSPSKSVSQGSYNASQLSKTKLNNIIPMNGKTYILTQGKGLWKIENNELTKE